MKTLGDLKWTSIDVLRVGTKEWDDGNTFPVVLMVSIEPNSASWEEADIAACRCRDVLCAHGLRDMECEIRESTCGQQASFGLIPARDVNRETSGRILPYSDLIGQSIAPSTNPTLESSICVYVAVGNNRDICALTCRHSLFGTDEPADQVQREIMNANPRVAVYQPGEATLKAGSKETENEIQTFTGQLQKRPQEVVFQKYVDRGKQDLHTISQNEDAATRQIGHVFYAQAQTVDSQGWLQDWGLIKLDQERYSTPFQDLQNWAWMGDLKTAKVLLGWIGEDYPQLSADYSAIRLGGTISVNEMFPTARAREEDTPLWVFKHGRTTGFTSGISNEVKSIVRRENPAYHADPIVTREWCIVADEPEKAFSESGDSGSAVFDANGRLGGMITGGCGSDDAFSGESDVLAKTNDVTYATPIEVIFESLKSKFGKVEIL